MADETYEVKVTLDNFNGIITGNGDGTYNVTYANLTNSQIEAIGAAFANQLSAADTNGNSKAGLNKIALSGEYNDLSKKPTLPDGYTQESSFHKVAFSGNTNDLNNDAGFLTSFTETDPVFTESVAAGISEEDINNWNNYNDSIENLNNSIGNKLQFIYFDTTKAPYLYPNFGITSFYTYNDRLIDDICNSLLDHKLPVLISTNGYWLITNYFINPNLNTKTLSINYIPSDIYYNILEEAAENVQQEENETDENYATRFNNYIMSGLILNTCSGLMIKDDNQNTSYFRFNILNTQRVLTEFNERLTALEKALNNS